MCVCCGVGGEGGEVCKGAGYAVDILVFVAVGTVHIKIGEGGISFPYKVKTEIPLF